MHRAAATQALLLECAARFALDAEQRVFLEEFLSNHDELRWLHGVHTDDFGTVARALGDCAARELEVEHGCLAQHKV